MKTTTQILITLLLAVSALAGAPLSKREAYELYVVIAAVDGANADNTVKLADNLVALRPHVEAYEAKVKALSKAADRLKLAARKDPKLLENLEEKLLNYQDEIEKEADSTVQVELKDVALSTEEVGTAKLRPAQLAVLRKLEKKKP